MNSECIHLQSPEFAMLLIFYVFVYAVAFIWNALPQSAPFIC